MPLEKLTMADVPVMLRSKIPKGVLMDRDMRRSTLSGMPKVPAKITVYEPKYYQTEGIADIKKHILDGKSVFRTEATGAGKTVEAILFCKEMGYKRILFLSPTESLSRQTASKFTNAGIPARAQTAKDRWWQPDTAWPTGIQAIMCSEGTAITRWMSAEPQIIIIDEAHHCYTEEELPQLSNVYVQAMEVASKVFPDIEQPSLVASKPEKFARDWNKEWHKQTRLLSKSKGQSKRRKAMGALRKRYNFTQLASIAIVAKEKKIHLVGFSATPWRLKDEEGFSEIWDVLSEGPQLRQLSEEGHLVPIKVHRMGGRIRKTANTRSAKGSDDFTPGQLTEMYERNTVRLTEEAIDWLQNTELDLNRKLKTIVFCCNQAHAKKVADYAVKKGRKVGLILSDSAYLEDYLEIADTLDKFAGDDLDTLVNVAMATEGIDIATADCCLILRDTVSRALLNQMAGRVTRVAAGKEYGLVMDATGCVSRLESPMVKRHWSLNCRAYKTDGDSPSADCVNRECFVRVHPAVSECWNCNSPQYNICSECNVRARGIPIGGVCKRCRAKRRLIPDARELNSVQRDEFEGQVVDETPSRFLEPAYTALPEISEESQKAAIEASNRKRWNTYLPKPLTWQEIQQLKPSTALTKVQMRNKEVLDSHPSLDIKYLKSRATKTGNYITIRTTVMGQELEFELFHARLSSEYWGRITYKNIYDTKPRATGKSNTGVLQALVQEAKEKLITVPLDNEDAKADVEWD